MDDAPFVKIAKALADPTRHRILQEIRAAGEMTCSDVCDGFRLAQPTISHHLKTLAAAGIIRVRADGQYHVLSVDEDVMREFARQLAPPTPRRAAAKTKKKAKARAKSKS